MKSAEKKAGRKMRAHKAEMLFKGFKLLLRSPGTFFKEMRRVFRPPEEYYQKRLSMTLRQWLLYHQKNIVFDQCSWMGVKALKNPFDSWIYQEIIYKVRPDVLIEIGSAEGGSTLYFAHLMDIIGHGEIISIDIERSKYNVEHDRITAITGKSSSEEVVKRVTELCKDKKVLVMHDGDHRKEAVLEDLGNYAKLVSVGSYLIVEDGISDLYKPGDGMGQWFEGPLKAVDEFLATNDGFVVDTDCERYILTYNPRGFLKRIK